MTQLLIKELRQITKSSRLGIKVSLDEPMRGNDSGEDSRSIEELIYSQLIHTSSYQNVTCEFSEDLYKKIIADVQEKIKAERRVLKCFQLKIAFPDIERATISKMLNISRPAISQYFERIDRLIELATKKYAF